MKISAATTEAGNLLFDPAEVSAARRIAVLVPGAFSRIGIFDEAAVWRGRGYGLVHYRFPGLDGRALSPSLDLKEASDEIAAFARRYPEKPLRLLGYSTGGLIALLAAAQLTGDVKVALMAPAVDRGGGIATARRTLADLVFAALDARSLRFEVFWFAYYRVLLFGRDVRRNTELAARADAIVASRRDKIVVPTAGLWRAHTRTVRRWRWPQALRFPEGTVRIFWGRLDPVFDRHQIQRFATLLGGAPVTEYPRQGHLLFASHAAVFEDIYGFFERDGHATPAAPGPA